MTAGQRRRREPWELDSKTRECGRRGVDRARRALDHEDPVQLQIDLDPGSWRTERRCL